MDLIWLRVCFNLKQFYASTQKTFINTFNAYYLNLDSITDCDSIEAIPIEPPPQSTVQSKSVKILAQIKRNIYYLFPAVSLTLVHLDSLVILARADFQYTFNGTQNLMTRKVTPKELWFQSDGVLNTGWSISWMVYWLLLLKPGIPPQFRIYAIGGRRSDAARIFSNGKFWNTDCVDKVVNFRNRARKLLIYCYQCGVIMAGLYLLWNAYQNYTGTWHEVAIIAYIPLLTIFANFGTVCIVFFIILSIRYFKIRQTALLSQLESFTAELKAKPSKQSHLFNWRRFCALNQDILRLNIELRAYSTYWSPFLTIIFVSYIAMDTMLLYGLVFQSESVNIFHKSFFIFYAIECLALLLLITHECAIIVQNNAVIFKANRAFCYACTRREQPNALCMLQMSKIISNYRGIKNGFRLINNFLIDSKMFEIIFFTWVRFILC